MAGQSLYLVGHCCVQRSLGSLPALKSMTFNTKASGKWANSVSVGISYRKEKRLTTDTPGRPTTTHKCCRAVKSIHYARSSSVWGQRWGQGTSFFLPLGRSFPQVTRKTKLPALKGETLDWLLAFCLYQRTRIEWKCLGNSEPGRATVSIENSN